MYFLRYSDGKFLCEINSCKGLVDDVDFRNAIQIRECEDAVTFKNAIYNVYGEEYQIVEAKFEEIYVK